jgi:hypothetical protein
LQCTGSIQFSGRYTKNWVLVTKSRPKNAFFGPFWVENTIISKSACTIEKVAIPHLWYGKKMAKPLSPVTQKIFLQYLLNPP